jgi:hypothetical protein
MADIGNPAVRATERWFIRQGMPMFVEEYSAGRDVWTRAVPVLAVILVVQVLGGITEARTLLGALVTFGVAAVALGLYAVRNRRAGRASFALPQQVGMGWLAAFVLIPTVLSVVLVRDAGLALQSFLSSVLLLGLVYVVTRYAFVAQVVWAVRWTFRQLSSVTRLITRVLPLMLLFITFLFINTEVWQVAGTMGAAVLWGSLAVFAVVGVLFIAGRSREEFGGIEVSTDAEEIARLTRGTPIEREAGRLDDLAVPVPLRRSQRANLVAVMVTAQLVQVALVGLVVWAFFVLFGAVAIGLDVQQAWMGDLATVDELVPLWDGHGVTRQLLRVSTFLGGFAAFYATVYAANDAVYREHFVARIGATVERAVAVRRAYVALRRREGLPVEVPDVRLDDGGGHHDELDLEQAPGAEPEDGPDGHRHPPVGPRGL